MKWQEIILYIVINALWVVPLLIVFYECISDNRKRRKANKEYVRLHGKKEKKRCLDCKYCSWHYSRTFYTPEYRNLMVLKVPNYCKKFYSHLPQKNNQQCIALWLNNAEFDGEESKPITTPYNDIPNKKEVEKEINKLQKAANKISKKNTPMLDFSYELTMTISKKLILDNTNKTNSPMK